MKRFIYVIFFVLVSFITFGQDITGTWNGVLDIQGTKLRLVIHIRQSENGYGATMDSPDQGATGIPVTSVSFEHPVLKFAVTNIGLTYEGKLSADGQTVTGDFKQNGLSLPLNLSRGNAATENTVRTPRPQNPAKPYPYYEEEVVFENPFAKDVKLAGTLTLPRKEGLFPAVALITGSGGQNRDEELMGHKPFLIIADYLTRNGIAVLRFDDRGCFASTGNFKTATTHDFSEDVESAVKYLQTRKEIDSKKIGLIGHSEGGAIAPMVAARNQDIAFIVLLAGTGIRGDQILLLQQYLIAEASGISKEDTEQAKRFNEGMFSIILQSTGTEQLKTDLTTYIKQVAKNLPDAAKETYDDNFIKASVERMTNPWMQYFIKYDPAPTLEKVKCPVLALNGEKDLQVPAKINLEAIEAALTKGGNKQFTTKAFPGLNHLFQTCTTGLPVEYGQIEESFSPAVLKEMLEWIKNTSQ
jgi:dienelactone hydrolase